MDFLKTFCNSRILEKVHVRSTVIPIGHNNRAIGIFRPFPLPVNVFLNQHTSLVVIGLHAKQIRQHGRIIHPEKSSGHISAPHHRHCEKQSGPGIIIDYLLTPEHLRQMFKISIGNLVSGNPAAVNAHQACQHPFIVPLQLIHQDVSFILENPFRILNAPGHIAKGIQFPVKPFFRCNGHIRSLTGKRLLQRPVQELHHLGLHEVTRYSQNTYHNKHLEHYFLPSPRFPVIQAVHSSVRSLYGIRMRQHLYASDDPFHIRKQRFVTD